MSDPEEPGKLAKKYKIKGSLVESPDGSIEKTKVFDFLQVPLDDYSDLEFTYDEVKRMQMHMIKMKTGVQAMAPLLCSGPVRCPFRYRCPIIDRSILTVDGDDIDFRKQDIKKFPLLRQCCFEREYFDSKRLEYLEEYHVNTESPTEVGMVNRLAELDLYEYRLALLFANGDHNGEGQDFLKEQISGVTPAGRPMTKTEIHPAFELKEKIHRMRDRILEAMIGTRREKLKQASLLRDVATTDISVNMAALSKRLELLSVSDDTIEVEFSETPEEE